MVQDGRRTAVDVGFPRWPRGRPAGSFARIGNAMHEAAKMKSVLVLYMSRGGHTARVARRICEGIADAGGRGEMMDINEAVHEGVDWGR
jgi:hypothetical protein